MTKPNLNEGSVKTREKSAAKAKSSTAQDKPRGNQKQSNAAATIDDRAKRIERIKADPTIQHIANRLALGMAQGDAAGPTESEMNFGLEMYARLKPTNAAEQLLTQQMVLTHETAIELLIRTRRAGNTGLMESNGGLALKLLSLFERQFLALTKSRQPKQVVEVKHEHRHIHAHRGDIPGDRVVSTIEGQAHAETNPTALAIGASTEMLSQDAPRHSVPAAGDAERPLPDARRGARKRSA